MTSFSTHLDRSCLVTSTDWFVIVKELLFHVYMSHSGAFPEKVLGNCTIPSMFYIKEVLQSHSLHQSTKPGAITNMLAFLSLFLFFPFIVTTVKKVTQIGAEVRDG